MEDELSEYGLEARTGRLLPSAQCFQQRPRLVLAAVPIDQAIQAGSPLVLPTQGFVSERGLLQPLHRQRIVGGSGMFTTLLGGAAVAWPCDMCEASTPRVFVNRKLAKADSDLVADRVRGVPAGWRPAAACL
jgi:hypothetical protein